MHRVIGLHAWCAGWVLSTDATPTTALVINAGNGIEPRQPYDNTVVQGGRIPALVIRASGRQTPRFLARLACPHASFRRREQLEDDRVGVPIKHAPIR
jgi:hypothetical protein